MFIEPPPSSPGVESVYASAEKSQGFRMNLAAAWAWRPDVFDRFAALRTTLVSESTLSKRDQAVLICATAASIQDAYCSLAWGKTLAQEAGPAAAAAVVRGVEDPALTARDRALAQWARMVASAPNTTRRQDVDALRAEGFSDREVFEITAFIAFRLAFSTVNDALGIAPDWQLADAAPEPLRNAVRFGREPAGKQA